MTYWVTPRAACSATRSSTNRARATMPALNGLVPPGSMSGRRRQPASGATSWRPISSSSTWGAPSTWTCMVRQRATRTAVPSAAAVCSSAMGRSVLRQGLETPDAPVGVTNGHLLGPEMAVLEIGATSTAGSGRTLHRAPSERVGPPALAPQGPRQRRHRDRRHFRSWPEAWSVSNSNLKAQCLEEPGCLAQLCVVRNRPSMPSVVMSGLPFR